MFKYYADFMGFGQKIQAGSYTLDRGMTIFQIASAGPGGWQAHRAQHHHHPGLDGGGDRIIWSRGEHHQGLEAFLALCRTGQQFADYYYVKLASGTVPQRKAILEGYLAPNTYEIYTDAKARTL